MGFAPSSIHKLTAVCLSACAWVRTPVRLAARFTEALILTWSRMPPSCPWNTPPSSAGGFATTNARSSSITERDSVTVRRAAALLGSDVIVPSGPRTTCCRTRTSERSKPTSWTGSPPTSPARRPPYAITRISIRSRGVTAASAMASTWATVSGSTSRRTERLGFLTSGARSSGFAGDEARLHGPLETHRQELLHAAERPPAGRQAAPERSEHLGREVANVGASEGRCLDVDAKHAEVQRPCRVAEVSVGRDHPPEVPLERVRRVVGVEPLPSWPGLTRPDVGLGVVVRLLGPEKLVVRAELDRHLEVERFLLGAEELRVRRRSSRQRTRPPRFRGTIQATSRPEHGAHSRRTSARRCPYLRRREDSNLRESVTPLTA